MYLALFALLSINNVTPADDLKQLEGSWEVVSMEANGKQAPSEKMPKKLTIAGSKLTGLGPEMEFKTDASKAPKWIDLTFKRGDQSNTLKAIYELQGDTLKLAIPLAQPGKAFENERPAGFESKGKLQATMILKRSK
jgi:uncharacterized protein (TIGR03067 family)